MLKEKVIHMMKENLVLDESRQNFVENQTNIISRLINGRLKDQNRFRCLLLGRKAVGKTFLLKKFGNALKECIQLDNFHFVYQDIAINKNLPSHVISEQLGFTLPTPKLNVSEIPTLDEELKKKNLFVFYVIDEFQMAYTKGYSKGIIEEINVIGSSSEGRIHCIVTGSSSVLRKLAFAKLKMTDPEYESYPNYEGVDLNSTKYQPTWMFPFVDANSFFELLERLNDPNFSIPNDKKALFNLIYTSGVFPGLLLRTDSPYSITFRTYLETPEYKSIVNTIYAFVSTFHGSLLDMDYNDKDDETSTREAINDLFSFSKLIERTNINCTEQQLYELADLGIIRFDGKYVGFGNVSLYFQYAHIIGTNSITPYQLMTLKSPSFDDSVPESLCLQLLALYLFTNTHSNTDLKSILCDIKFESVGSIYITSNENDKKNDPPSTEIVHVNHPESAILSNKIYKEKGSKGRDCFGGDAIIFTNTDPNTYIVYRIQVKMGKSNLNQTVLNEVYQRFSQNESNVSNALKSKITNFEIKNYLLTTRPYPPNLDFHGIHLINAGNLKPIWPDIVKNLGKPYH